RKTKEFLKDERGVGASRMPAKRGLSEVLVFSRDGDESPVIRVTERRGRSGRVTDGGDAGFVSFAVNHAVHPRIAHHDLNIFASLREGNGLDEFWNLFVAAFPFPEGEAVLASVISGGRILRRAGSAGEIGEVKHAEFDVDRGVEKRCFGVADLPL